LVEYTGDPDYPDKMGSHVHKVRYQNWQEIKPGHWQDYWGVEWNKTVDKDIGVVEVLLLPEPSLEGFKAPEIDEARLRKLCEDAIKDAGDRCRTYCIGFSTFERAWSLRGMENLLMDMIIYPDFVHGLLDIICEHNLKLLNIALEYPFDCCYFGDDWGQQKGTIMGPNYWREFIKPRIARVYDKAKRSGKFIAHHSCGDISELFPDLIEIGLDVYQTFQPEIYDVKAVKQEYGKDLSFWGAISTQRVLPFVSPDEVKRVTREMLDVLGKGGGYIAGPTHDIPGDVPPENIVAMVEVLQGQ
jgi:uroporphyrinogen decarboxylase